MSDNKTFIEEVEKMDVNELLLLILNCPEYLTDSYYSEFGKAIRKRGDALNIEVKDND